MPPSQPPHRRILMNTRLSAEEALQRLTRSIEKQAPIFPFQPRPRTWLFAGTITGYQFSISRIPAGKRIYENQIDGVIAPTSDGASITLTIQPHRSSVLTKKIGAIIPFVFGLLFVLGPLYFAILGQLAWNCGLFPLIVAILAVYFLRAIPTSTATFDVDALTALANLRSIFATETERSLDDENTPTGQ